MALVASSAVLLAVVVFASVATAFGHRILRVLAPDFSFDALSLLCSIALGVIGIEVLFFFAQFSGHIRIGVVAVLALAVLLGFSECTFVFERLSRSVHQCLGGSRTEKFLMALAASALLIEG